MFVSLQVSPVAMSIGKTLVTVILAAHLLSCFWFWVHCYDALQQVMHHHLTYLKSPGTPCVDCPWCEIVVMRANTYSMYPGTWDRSPGQGYLEYSLK